MEKKEFVTLSPTKVEVTGFNDQDSQRLGASERVDNSDHKCIVGTRSNSGRRLYIRRIEGGGEKGL
jgi:hypothetical protein